MGNWKAHLKAASLFLSFFAWGAVLYKYPHIVILDIVILAALAAFLCLLYFCVYDIIREHDENT